MTNQTKKSRTILVDKPTFAPINVNDPIKYVLKDQGNVSDRQKEYVPEAALENIPEVKAVSSKFEKVRSMFNPQINTQTPSSVKKPTIDTFWNKNQNAMSPEITRELLDLETIGPDKPESFSRWEFLLDKYKDDPEQTDILYDYSDIRYPTD